jgi:hypothetical protein
LKARNRATWASSPAPDVVDHQQAAGSERQFGAGLGCVEKHHRCAAVRGRGGGRQQVALAAAGGAPDVEGLEAARVAQAAQALQQFGVGADDEVVQRRRLLGLEVEQHLAVPGIHSSTPIAAAGDTACALFAHAGRTRQCVLRAAAVAGLWRRVHFR